MSISPDPDEAPTKTEAPAELLHVDPGELQRESRRDSLAAQRDPATARRLFIQRLEVVQADLTQLDLAWQMLAPDDQQRIIDGCETADVVLMHDLSAAMADLPTDIESIREQAQALDA